MTTTERRRWSVDGRSGRYVVLRHANPAPEDDAWTCTCKGFVIYGRRHHRFQCRHIKQVKKTLIAAFVAGLE